MGDVKYSSDDFYRTDRELRAKYVTTKKVKQSLYRSGQFLRFTGGGGSQISRQSAREDSKFVIPKQRPSFPPRKYSG
jgi:hypothetical protein